MRVNIYSQELVNEVELVEKRSHTGANWHAVRFVLHSSDKLHFTPKDDDRSAVTFWLPNSARRRTAMIEMFYKAAELIANAPIERGGGQS